MTAPSFFITKKGEAVRPVAMSDLQAARATLFGDYGLSTLQAAESAALGEAMVIRFALGLSAAEGRVCGIVRDSLPGLVTLATLRHLSNSGAEAMLIAFPEDAPSELFQNQLQQAERFGIEHIAPDILDDDERFQAFLGSCHNLICGLWSEAEEQGEKEKRLVEILNEHSAPVHAIECPIGICPDTGKRKGEALFASSTLALGAPLSGLLTAEDYVGRLYVSDISLPKALYQPGDPGTELFSDQPVVQLLRPKTSEETA